MTPTISNSLWIVRDSGTVFGNTATVYCADGYAGSGLTGVITCGSGATWGGFNCTGKILIRLEYIVPVYCALDFGKS